MSSVYVTETPHPIVQAAWSVETSPRSNLVHLGPVSHTNGHQRGKMENDDVLETAYIFIYQSRVTENTGPFFRNNSTGGGGSEVLPHSRMQRV